ncbi:MAG: hypothetical protein ACJ76Y_16490 [Thermoanaerobaculia bacterium]
MAEREPALRAVLLGASNLRISLPLVLDRVRRRAGGPVEALAACGHGRSWGTWSRFLFVRHLPGIAQCGLWRELRVRPSRPTLALLTDVGNDLLYGARVEEIAGWVETCLDRLGAREETETVMTLLPLARLERLSGPQVRLAASLLFPGRPAPWPALLDRARELDDRLRRLGRERGARLVEPAAGWYGLDPIHLRRRARREAWAQILPGPAGAAGGGQRLPFLGAAESRLFGAPLRRPQPAVRLPDGSTVALY